MITIYNNYYCIEISLQLISEYTVLTIQVLVCLCYYVCTGVTRITDFLPSNPLGVKVTTSSSTTITLTWEQPDSNCNNDCQYEAMIWLINDPESLVSQVCHSFIKN